MSRFGLAPALDLGTVQVWQPLPEVSDFVKFVQALSLGADNFNAYRQRVSPRRASGIPGVWADYGHGNAGMTVHLTAFGETAEALWSAITSCLKSYPPEEFHTRFTSPEQIDGEWIAPGSRYAERNWV